MELACNYAPRMSSTLAANIRYLRSSLDLNQTDFAERVGGKQPNVSKWEAGTSTPTGDVLAAMAELAGCTFDQFKNQAIVAPTKSRTPEAGHRGDRPEQPATKTADSGETAPVTRLDLSYSMGPGTTIDSAYVDGEAFEFDVGFLRSMTITPAERLRIVDGIGDSMEPTLHDRDLLFVDVNQATLNAQDRIWAIWLFGVGAVKRLRALDADRVEVISDNPAHENQVVKRTDIFIHGRVVGSIKRH